MSCKLIKKPILSKKTNFAIAQESKYGQIHGRLKDLAIYNLDIVNQNTDKLLSSVKNTENGKTSVGIGPYYDLRVSTYMMQNDTWKYLLMGAGYIQDGYRMVLGKYPQSFYAECNYDGVHFPLRGNRGSFNISGQAGAPVSLTYTGRALWTDPTEMGEAYDSVGEIDVPILQNADFRIMLPTNDVIHPEIVSFQIECDRDIYNKLPGGDPNGNIESFGLSDLWNLSISMVVEYDQDFRWDTYFREKSKYNLIGFTIGDVINIKNGEGTKIILDNMPTLGDTNNIRVVNLKFNLIGSKSLIFELL